ncbi:MAG: sensor histidine kinase [Burkholderiaceae bacterium]
MVTHVFIDLPPERPPAHRPARAAAPVASAASARRRPPPWLWAAGPLMAIVAVITVRLLDPDTQATLHEALRSSINPVMPEALRTALDGAHPWNSVLLMLVLLQSAALWWTTRAKTGAGAPGVAATKGAETATASSDHLLVREAERRLIARDLHDELGQLLSLLRLRAAMLPLQPLQPHTQDLAGSAREIVELADQSIQSLRALVFQLRPTALERGIGPALQRLAADTQRHAGLSCACRVDFAATLDADTALQLFRIAQEALGNALRHARARHIAIELKRVTGGLLLSISDDGIGFNAARALLGQGLLSMRERARLLGGELRCISSAGRGTRVELHWAPPGVDGVAA